MNRRAPEPPHYPDLATYLTETGDTQTRVAARCGTTPATISRIANGLMVPRALLAVQIATYARIPLDSFLRVYLTRHIAKVAS